MSHEEDFETGEVIDLIIEGYEPGEFKYEPPTAADENSWLNKFTTIGKDGKPVQDFSIMNKLKATRLCAVPYSKEQINKLIGINKEWSELNVEARWILLGKLKGRVFDKILNAIIKYDQGDVEKKENSEAK